MKKRLVTTAILLTMMIACICGCGKKETGSKSVDICAGVYQNRLVEEIGGEEQAYYYYLILNEDGTGTLDAQDTVPVKWDAKSVKTDSTDYKTSFNGKMLSLEDNGVTVEYKYLKEITLDEFFENRDNPEYMFYIEDMAYIKNSFVEEQANKNSFDSYDEVISYLTPGQAYAYIEMYGYDGKVLVVTDELYDDGDGNKLTLTGTVYAKADDEVTYMTVAFSDGTARPIAVKDGVLMEATQHSAAGYFFVLEGNAVMAKFSVYEDYDEEANVTYGGFVRETNSFDDENEKWIETEEEYVAAYEEYLSADPIKFTVVK